MSTTDTADELALEEAEAHPGARRRGIRALPVIVVIAFAVIPWMLVGAESIRAAASHLLEPATLRTQDVAAMLPLLCVALSICAVLSGGPSDKPRLEPSMLAAVPGLAWASTLLALGVPRFGFGFWDLRLDLWALSLGALVSIMLVSGVRHPLRYGVWAMWLLAFPLVSMWMAELWSQASWQVAKYVGATDGPPTMVNDVDGFAVFLVLVGLLTLRVDIARGRRLRITLLLLAATFATAEARDALWLMFGNGSQLPATLLRTALLVGVAGLLMQALAPSKESGVMRHRWMRHMAARPVWTRKYVVVAGGWYLAMLLLATLATQDLPFRTGVRLLRTDDRTNAAFPPSIAPEAIDLPIRRANVDAPQRPEPWDQLTLPIAGHETCAQQRPPWYVDVFADAPIVAPFTTRPNDRPWSDPLVRDDELTWVMVMPTRNRTLANQLEPTNQFEAHLSRMYRVRQVQVLAGSVTLIYQSHHGHDFASAHFTQSMTLPGGRPAYRTVVVVRSVDPDSRADARIPKASTRFSRIAYAMVDRVRQWRDLPPPPVDFHSAALDVLRTVDDITAAEHTGEAIVHDDASTAGLERCSWQVSYSAVPRVQRID